MLVYVHLFEMCECEHTAFVHLLCEYMHVRSCIICFYSIGVWSYTIRNASMSVYEPASVGTYGENWSLCSLIYDRW